MYISKFAYREEDAWGDRLIDLVHQRCYSGLKEKRGYQGVVCR